LEELAVSRERNRLARELHDTLAHGLTAVAVQLEAVNALWDAAPGEARATLARALDTTRASLTDARRAIAALRAAPVEDLGLARAVRELAESAAWRAGLALDAHIPDRVRGLEPEAEHAAYRIAAEAVANVVKHAAAHRLGVCFEEKGPQLPLGITDDGRGCDLEAVPADRFGIQGMRERARAVGGTLHLASAPGAGTSVRLTLESVDDSRPDL